MEIAAGLVQLEWRDRLPIFCSEAYLRTTSKEYGWVGGRLPSGELVCVLPYYVVRSRSFRLVRFASETVWMESEFGIEEEVRFLNNVVGHFRDQGMDLIIPPTFNSLFRTFPDHAIAAPYGTYRIDLSQPEDDLWARMHQKHRNVIRSAAKKGVTIKTQQTYSPILGALVRDSFERSSRTIIEKLRVRISIARRDLSSLTSSLGDHVKMFVAEREGVIQGCAIIPYSRYCAYYMHGGSVAQPATGAMNLLQWEAIKYFRAAGVRYYNFVGSRIDPEPGSKQEGLAKFKQRFGGELLRGYMWKFPLRPWKNRLYRMASILRSGGDVVDQEKHKLMGYDAN